MIKLDPETKVSDSKTSILFNTVSPYSWFKKKKHSIISFKQTFLNIIE